MVRHGHFMVNGRKVDIPSYLTRPGDEVAVREKSRTRPFFKEVAAWRTAQEALPWLEIEPEQMKTRITRFPAREELDVPITEQLIVEHYSR